MSRAKGNSPTGEVLSENIGKIESRYITKELQESYLDYAMSVIVQRALPDVRDGLKPVQRRILYSMWQIGLKSASKFKKSANVVGEVMGKYHPHGDSAIYEAMVRMAQDFSYRTPLVNGQGNFGSMDGDPPAAMRYTEVKLNPAAEALLENLEKETVDFVSNYDETQKEPKVLPAGIPNLLLNGSVGIAVGMATNIPTFNLGELIDGIVYLIDHPESTVVELMQFIKGPDFPTGGIIYNQQNIEEALATGKGSIVIRGRAEIVEAKSGQWRIVINELPYQVNKASFVENIAELVKNKKIEGIKDLRDESDREGVRVVVELKKDAYPKKILNQLFKYTQLQDTFHMNLLALVDGIQPRVLTLKMVLEEFIKHRQEVVKRRAAFDLTRARERAHILKGLKIALDKIDAVIKLIKRSADKEVARAGLMKKFRLTAVQATAILEMKLQQLANLERQKINDELREKLKYIKEIEALLASTKKVFTVIKKELADATKRLSTSRRTEVRREPAGEFSQEDLVPNEPTVVTITQDGYIKRLSPDVFKTQSRGGKGVAGLVAREGDVVEHFFAATTHTNLLFFTTKGRVFELKAYEVPPGSRTTKGQAVVNFLQLAPQEKISAVQSLENLSDYKYLVMVTSGGFIKKVDIKDFTKVRRSGLVAIRLKPNDELQWVKASRGKDEIIIVTEQGQAIRFKEGNVRSMGRAASGVRAVRFRNNDDCVLAMDIISQNSLKNNPQLLVISQLGYGKRSLLKNYKVQGRGGSGIKTSSITSKTGKLVAARLIYGDELDRDIIAISHKGQVIRLPLKSVSLLGRATQGVRLMRFKEKDDQVASAVVVD